MPHIYEPREVFKAFHNRSQRYACIVAHRRCGKTVAAVNELLTRALATRKADGRYAYIAPFHNQCKQIAWDLIKKYGAEVITKISESELSVTLFNGSRIRLYGADNPHALRGIYLDGVFFDEFADMKPSIFGEIVRPMLADRRGWAVWIGTPRGHDHFWEMHQQAQASPDWFSLTLKASETGLIPQAELDDARLVMSADQYKQEMEIDFEAAIQGAIFAKEIQAARDAGRIGRVPYDHALPVSTAWDLGVRDSTAIWFFQLLSHEVRVIDFYEASGEGLPHYAKVLQDRGYVFARHIAPHDIAVRELGSGRSRIEVAASLGIKFEIAPNVPLEDGIHAGRLWFSRCWFDETKCKAGLESLQHYQWSRNERLGELNSTPLRNFATHAADALRYAALALKDKPQKVKREAREIWRGEGAWMR